MFNLRSFRLGQNVSMTPVRNLQKSQLEDVGSLKRNMGLQFPGGVGTVDSGTDFAIV